MKCELFESKKYDINLFYANISLHIATLSTRGRSKPASDRRISSASEEPLSIILIIFSVRIITFANEYVS